MSGGEILHRPPARYWPGSQWGATAPVRAEGFGGGPFGSSFFGGASLASIGAGVAIKQRVKNTSLDIAGLETK